MVVARKTWVLLATLLLLALPSVARSPQELEATIDFDTSLTTIAEAVRTGTIDRIDSERYFMLEGSVASIFVFDPNPETFLAVIELVSARWESLDAIDVDRLYVRFQGPAFAKRVAERTPQDPAPDFIRMNQEVLVIGPFAGTAQLDDEELAVIDAVRVR